MRNKKKIVAGLALFGCFVLGWFGWTTLGEASEFQFSVNPTIPANQVDKTKTYFDLQMNKNQRQTLEVVLRNDTEKAVKVDLGIDNATTNSNGVVEYGKRAIKQDSSLRYALSELTEYPETVTIEAQSEKKVAIQVQMPDQAFDGVIAGGITFKEHQEAQTTATNEQKKGVSITNEYAYVVALLLRQTTKKVAPEVVLHDVTPSQKNARNVILANLQNTQATYVNQVKVQAEITRKGSQKVLYQATNKQMQIAPNSNFDYPVALNGKKLEAGKYRIKVTVYGNQDPAGSYQDSENPKEHYQNRWVLEKDFEIKADTAKALNEKDVSLKQDYRWVFWLIGALLLMLLLLILLLLWRKKRKDEATDDEQADND